jgi:uncharacterized protein (DUF1697 family)
VTTQVVLIRGINVGGKNAVRMAELRELLDDLGCTDVVTLLNSGNAVVDSGMSAAELASQIERELPKRFRLDDELIRVLVLTEAAFRTVVDERPAGFGDEPQKYHSDAIFLIGVTVKEAMKSFDPRDGVDAVWPGSGVVYSRRLSAERTKSRLSKIVATPAYKSMTIRSWTTTTKLLKILDDRTDAS